MHNSMNPYGGPNPLIDKMIGNAYDIVKYVAKYLKEIRYVAENMQYVYAAANGNRLRYVIQGNGSAELYYTLPADFPYDSVESITVMGASSGNWLIPPGPDTFSYRVANGDVIITMLTTDPAITGASFRITAVYFTGT